MGTETAVSDTGPLIHLSEVGRLMALGIVSKLLLPAEVSRELKSGEPCVEVSDYEWMEVTALGRGGEDCAAAVSRRYGLGLGEAEAIALSLERGVRLIFTDDLNARTVAKSLDLEPHGSIGILLRAYREGILSQAETIQSVRDLNVKSSLYLASDLTNRAIRAVREYPRS